jgi:hypothetical protein
VRQEMPVFQKDAHVPPMKIIESTRNGHPIIST